MYSAFLAASAFNKVPFSFDVLKSEKQERLWCQAVTQVTLTFSPRVE